jgi:hypothetical protein
MAEEEKKKIKVRRSKHYDPDRKPEEPKRGRGRPRKEREPVEGDENDIMMNTRLILRERQQFRKASASYLPKSTDYDVLQEQVPLPDDPIKSEWRERQPASKRNSTRMADRAGLITTEEDADFLSKQLGACLVAYMQPDCHSDEELQERIYEFFQWCQKQAHLPTFEEMALYCGMPCYKWNRIIKGQQRGFSEDTANILARAKEVLKALDAALAEKSQINVAAYIFRAKNYYDMVDKVETVISPAEEEEPIAIDDIQKRYGLTDYIDGEFSEVDTEGEE